MKAEQERPGLNGAKAKKTKKFEMMWSTRSIEMAMMKAGASTVGSWTTRGV